VRPVLSLRLSYLGTSRPDPQLPCRIALGCCAPQLPPALRGRRQPLGARLGGGQGSSFSDLDDRICDVRPSLALSRCRSCGSLTPLGPPRRQSDPARADGALRQLVLRLLPPPVPDCARGVVQGAFKLSLLSLLDRAVEVLTLAPSPSHPSSPSPTLLPPFLAQAQLADIVPRPGGSACVPSRARTSPDPALESDSLPPPLLLARSWNLLHQTILGLGSMCVVGAEGYDGGEAVALYEKTVASIKPHLFESNSLTAVQVRPLSLLSLHVLHLAFEQLVLTLSLARRPSRSSPTTLRRSALSPSLSFLSPAALL